MRLFLFAFLFLGACSFTQEKPMAAKTCVTLRAISESLQSEYSLSPQVVMRNSKGNALIYYASPQGRYATVEVTPDKCAAIADAGVIVYIAGTEQGT